MLMLKFHRLGVFRTIALILLFSGCSGGDNGGGNRGGGEGAGKPDLTSDSFLTPSNNIACLLRGETLRCDILSGLDPEPKFPCPVDWTGVYIEALVDAGPVCAGDTVMDPEASTLEYGQTWSQGGELTCDSAASGLRCVDTSGNGFTLARAGWEILGKSAAAEAAFPELRNMIRAKANRFGQGEVARVSARRLVGGLGCGNLQEASVTVEFAVEPSPGTYFVCYLSGRWIIESGPNFGE